MIRLSETYQDIPNVPNLEDSIVTECIRTYFEMHWKGWRRSYQLNFRVMYLESVKTNNSYHCGINRRCEVML